ncbi:thermonuclease family protein [Goodfellowiella coeruleoviolacea]|uniref:Endonuclease YncB, thermonuclease family n=1 Tax=Goodfellowiella coeruleoviolacea TaxID=334858 RepID=A0AAE3GE43_9PSEU|nr:excalibur calcium-binding domain-containing protein [Goodfellowiella coeruleoviolacea]MCP2164443.1 Endonuclease YncB, thermonuclease family [Goodfellowiella coeruleoviolacea]
MAAGQPTRFRERWRRVPRWLRVGLLALVALVLVAGIFGDRESTGQQAATSPAPATTSSTTTASSTSSPAAATTPSTPPPLPTVVAVTDARTVVLSDGLTVTLDSLAVPGECWRDPATEFARTTLLNKQVQWVAQGHPPALRLADGTDFATLAVSQGLARPATPGSPLSQAQDTAHQAGLGLWGEPCRGADTLPVTTPPPEATPERQPTREPDPPVVQQQPEAVYYANCSQAKAAGAAPLHRGEPGYRAGLDRDNDGVACES